MTDTDNKQRADNVLLKKQQYNLEVKEILERLGVDPEIIANIDLEANPATADKIQKAKNIVQSIAESELFEKDDNDKYKIYSKITAITIMSVSVGIMEDFGTGKEATPYYAGVHRWTGVPISTLRRWWANQTVIMREQIGIGSAAVQRVTLKQLEIMELYTDGLILTPEEMKELRKTPKGLNVISKIVAQSIYNAKLLITQGEVISKADTQKSVKEATANKYGVTVIYPHEIKPDSFKVEKDEGETKDASDITDN
ncbi:MAG: hypothetical protein V3W20_00620 [Candidatus Neomarinimicrobiota bacterium]